MRQHHADERFDAALALLQGRIAIGREGFTLGGEANVKVGYSPVLSFNRW